MVVWTTVVDELLDWDWVAIGTLLLAVATFVLATQKPAGVVRGVARREARRAGEGLDLGSSAKTRRL